MFYTRFRSFCFLWHSAIPTTGRYNLMALFVVNSCVQSFMDFAIIAARRSLKAHKETNGAGTVKIWIESLMYATTLHMRPLYCIRKTWSKIPISLDFDVHGLTIWCSFADLMQNTYFFGFWCAWPYDLELICRFDAKYPFLWILMCVALRFGAHLQLSDTFWRPHPSTFDPKSTFWLNFGVRNLTILNGFTVVDALWRLHPSRFDPKWLFWLNFDVPGLTILSRFPAPGHILMPPTLQIWSKIMILVEFWCAWPYDFEQICSFRTHFDAPNPPDLIQNRHL
jgi:hypothetical protein